MERLQRALNHRAIRLLGPLLGLICSAVFVSRLDFPEVGAAFHGLAWYWLPPVLLFGCLNLWLRAVRWGVLLAPWPGSDCRPVAVTPLKCCSRSSCPGSN
jgi:hypothetical protein